MTGRILDPSNRLACRLLPSRLLSLSMSSISIFAGSRADLLYSVVAQTILIGETLEVLQRSVAPRWVVPTPLYMP